MPIQWDGSLIEMEWWGDGDGLSRFRGAVSPKWDSEVPRKRYKLYSDLDSKKNIDEVERRGAGPMIKNLLLEV